MAIIETVVRTVTCDAPGCNKTITFDKAQSGPVLDNPENAWLKTGRLTQTADGRNSFYCSDICEVKAVETGRHNPLEAPRVQEATSPAAIAIAAKAAEAARQADAAIRKGQPAKVQLTD